MNINNLDDVKYRIHKIKVLNENDKKAKAVLNKAAEQVRPIMRKRYFSVELLSEFLPKDPNLLGLNIVTKSEIKIRLRKKRGDAIFHFNHIVGTLLHELAHITHRRHDKSFYELLDKLICEYNELYIYNGKNILPTRGKTVGSNKSSFCNSNPKLMAAQAAERRLINNFINKDGEIINLSLESCLTTEQFDNLIKNRREYDEKCCSLSIDIIEVDSLGNHSKGEKNKDMENGLNTKCILDVDEHYISGNSKMLQSVNEKLKFPLNKNKNEEKITIISNTAKTCSSNEGNINLVYICSKWYYCNDCVRILEVKEVSSNRDNSTLSNKACNKKEKKRKVIVLD
ncbi:metallopeptidase, putative [Plasmodium ovale]|uniref:Metallopeptidase, putative n=1 Tax=Plasmodium ovale TaxID=36330 RepID=A0A1C3KRB1_PLAOA|nr:metallopeptidase, putative [Plasmodium ovale]